MLHRAGRITASKCYDVCHADTEKTKKKKHLWPFFMDGFKLHQG